MNTKKYTKKEIIVLVSNCNTSKICSENKIKLWKQSKKIDPRRVFQKSKYYKIYVMW